MCEGEEMPLCVKWCSHDVLTYEEREVEVEEEAEKPEQLDIGLESLADKYGMQKVLDAVARLTKKDD
jgi:benzoyl-CoA reductase subunit BamC